MQLCDWQGGGFIQRGFEITPVAEGAAAVTAAYSQIQCNERRA